jgi:hypothetical protein
MRKAAIVLAGLMSITNAGPAWSDGSRDISYGRLHRVSHSSFYGIGLISRNVITPYYYGYYGSHYSYVAPDPIPARVYHPVTCWYWSDGYYFRVC